MIEHSIDLVPGSVPRKSTLPRYTHEEREFAEKILPEMVEAGILERMTSNWGSRTKFPPKKKGSSERRVVHNYIPLNRATIKSAYPVHSMDEVIDIVLSPEHRIFFTGDASWSYWAIPIRPGDEFKMGTITPHGQYVYKRMAMGLKDSMHTYTQFADLVFGPIPGQEGGVGRFKSLIGKHEGWGFCPFVDDHNVGATDFKTMFKILHEEYFPRLAFGPIYLNGRKVKAFESSMESVGFFQGGGRGSSAIS